MTTAMIPAGQTIPGRQAFGLLDWANDDPENRAAEAVNRVNALAATLIDAGQKGLALNEVHDASTVLHRLAQAVESPAAGGMISGQAAALTAGGGISDQFLDFAHAHQTAHDTASATARRDAALHKGEHVPGTPYTYHHGWILIGRAFPGQPLSHPDMGAGVISSVAGGKVNVDFGKGVKAQFERGQKNGGAVDLDPGLRRRVTPPETRPPLDDAAFDAMTPEQTSAVLDYISPEGSEAINGALRAGKMPGKSAGIGPDGYYGTVSRAAEVETLDQLIASHTTTKPVVLYRGIAMSSLLASQLKPGTVFTDKGFTSTSDSLDWAQKFATLRTTGTMGEDSPEVKAQGGKPVTMNITVPAGSHMGPGEPDIGEFVLPRGGQYRVDSISPDGNMYNLTAIPPSPQQLTAKARQVQSLQAKGFASPGDPDAQDIARAARLAWTEDEIEVQPPPTITRQVIGLATTKAHDTASATAKATWARDEELRDAHGEWSTIGGQLKAARADSPLAALRNADGSWATGPDKNDALTKAATGRAARGMRLHDVVLYAKTGRLVPMEVTALHHHWEGHGKTRSGVSRRHRFTDIECLDPETGETRTETVHDGTSVKLFPREAVKAPVPTITQRIKTSTELTGAAVHDELGAPALTPAQAAAFSRYQDPEGKYVNDVLHQGAGADQQVAAMDSAFADARPTASPVVVYRSMNAKRVPAVGGTFTDSGFASTTTEPEIAANYGGTVVRVHVPAGSKAISVARLVGEDPHSPLASDALGITDKASGDEVEREVLLPRGSTFKVTGKSGRYTDVELQPAASPLPATMTSAVPGSAPVPARAGMAPPGDYAGAPDVTRQSLDMARQAVGVAGLSAAEHETASRELARIFDQTPVLAGIVHSVKFQDAALGATGRATPGTITLDAGLVHDPARWDALVVNRGEKGWHAGFMADVPLSGEYSGLRYTMTHEAGHELSWETGQYPGGNIAVIRAVARAYAGHDFPAGTKGLHQAEAVLSDKHRIRTGTSDYATYNWEEGYAEAFADYSLGGQGKGAEAGKALVDAVTAMRSGNEPVAVPRVAKPERVKPSPVARPVTVKSAAPPPPAAVNAMAPPGNYPGAPQVSQHSLDLARKMTDEAEDYGITPQLHEVVSREMAKLLDIVPGARDLITSADPGMTNHMGMRLHWEKDLLKNENATGATSLRQGMSLDPLLLTDAKGEDAERSRQLGLPPSKSVYADEPGNTGDYQAFRDVLTHEFGHVLAIKANWSVLHPEIAENMHREIATALAGKPSPADDWTSELTRVGAQVDGYAAADPQEALAEMFDVAVFGGKPESARQVGQILARYAQGGQQPVMPSYSLANEDVSPVGDLCFGRAFSAARIRQFAEAKGVPSCTGFPKGSSMPIVIDHSISTQLANGPETISGQVELAAIHGHHIPGTQYTFRHGWIPLIGQQFNDTHPGWLVDERKAKREAAAHPPAVPLRERTDVPTPAYENKLSPAQRREAAISRARTIAAQAGPATPSAVPQEMSDDALFRQMGMPDASVRALKAYIDATVATKVAEQLGQITSDQKKDIDSRFAQLHRTNQKLLQFLRSGEKSDTAADIRQNSQHLLMDSVFNAAGVGIAIGSLATGVPAIAAALLAVVVPVATVIHNYVRQLN